MASNTKPNILFLFADDQRNHTLGCAGHPVVKTPNIDALAKGGVRFENAFVTTSTCWVSRACLFTGCYERKHLYRVTPGPLNPELCDSSYFTVLKRAGYRTGHLGKEHVNLSDESAAAMFDVRRKLFRKPYFKKQDDGSQRHETQILGDWAIEFLNEQTNDQPFCLQLSFNATHAEDGDRRPGIGHFPWPKVTDGMYENQQMPLPQHNDPAIYAAQPDFLKKSINRQRYFWRWDTPEKYQTNMRAYFRMISGIDHVVGRIVKQLEEQGLADNTVIIYTADNGYARYYVNGANEPPFEFLHDLVNDPDQRNNLALKLKDGDAMKEIRAHCDKLIAEAGPAMKDVGEDQRASRKKQPVAPKRRKK